MSFPSISFKATNCELTVELQELIEQKLSALGKYLPDNADNRCDIECERETAHQTGKHFRIEANLLNDGTMFRAEATEESFERAIDELVDELDKQLRRHNDKEIALQRQGGRELKEKMMTV